MKDAILEAQNTLADGPTPAPYNNENNPKESGGGEVSAKAPHLERETPMLIGLIIILSIGLAFALGYYMGRQTGNTGLLESRVHILESALIEHKKSIENQVVEQPAKTIEQQKKRPSQSAVMHYHNPKEVRKEKEQLALEAIEKEIASLATDRDPFAVHL